METVKDVCGNTLELMIMCNNTVYFVFLNLKMKIWQYAPGWPIVVEIHDHVLFDFEQIGGVVSM